MRVWVMKETMVILIRLHIEDDEEDGDDYGDDNNNKQY